MLIARLLVLALALLAGCRPSSDEARPQPALIDALGREVPVQAPVRSVIPLAPGLTEIAVAAGGGDRLVAVSQADNYPPWVTSLTRVSTLPLDLERIVALQPELLLADASVNRQDHAARLAALGIPTYFFSFSSLADVPAAIRRVGHLLDTGAVAEASARAFEERLRALGRRLPAGPRPRVLVLIGDDTLFAFGGGSYIHELVALAGGESVTARFPGEGVILSHEYVLEAAPEVIVVAAAGPYDPAAFARRHRALRIVPAVRDERIYAIPPDLLLRAGPRLVDGAEALAALIRAGEGA